MFDMIAMSTPGLQMVIYDKPFFSGKSRTINTNMRDFLTRTDRQQNVFMSSVGSLKVQGGMWVLLSLLCTFWSSMSGVTWVQVQCNKPLLYDQIQMVFNMFLCLQLGGLRERGLPRPPVPAGGGGVPRLEGVGRLQCRPALRSGDTSCKLFRSSSCLGIRNNANAMKSLVKQKNRCGSQCEKLLLELFGRCFHKKWQQDELETAPAFD